MNKKKKKIYIDSIEGFNKWLRDRCERGMIYRGMENSRRCLSASLYHRLGGKEEGNSPKDMLAFIDATKELIQEAKREGHHQNDGKEMKNLELLAGLQHIGAATCLIDFSDNPFVALWFACRPTTDKNPPEGKVVALYTKNPEYPDKFTIVESEHWGNDIDTFLDKGQLWIWSPPKQNSRIIAQQSVFILGKGVIEKKEIDETCFINKKAKKNILRELEKHGISEDFLFCDYDGFARQNAWNKPYQDLTSKDYLFRAMYAFQSNDLDKAIENCDKAIKKKHPNTSAYYIRGRIRRKKGDYKEAIADFDKVIRSNKRHEDAYCFRGIAKSQKGDYVLAIADFRKAIKINPKHEDAHYFRGIAKSQKGDYDGAITDFSKVIRITRQHEKAYYFRGIAKWEKGDHNKAIADFSKIIKKNSRNASAYYIRGRIKIMRGNYDKAIADFDKVVEINPKHGNAYYLRGQAKLEERDYYGAIMDFDKSLEINPKHEDAYYLRGVAKSQKGNYEEAIMDCSKAIKINSRYAEAYYHRGLINYRLGNYKEATKDYRKARKYAPDNSTPYNMLED